MTTLGLIFVALAALVHVYIFVLESLRFDQPATWRVFGVKNAQEAEVMRPWAYNQGFYNLFLAVVTAAGIAAIIMGHKGVGAALVFAGAGSMAAAAAVLLASAPGKARAALTQGILPTVGVVLLGIALAGS